MHCWPAKRLKTSVENIWLRFGPALQPHAIMLTPASHGERTEAGHAVDLRYGILHWIGVLTSLHRYSTASVTANRGEGDNRCRQNSAGAVRLLVLQSQSKSRDLSVASSPFPLFNFVHHLVRERQFAPPPSPISTVYHHSSSE